MGATIRTRAWNPAHHPRDSRGRFTRSSTRVMTDRDRRKLAETADGFDFTTDGVVPTPTPRSDAVDRYAAGDWASVNSELRRGREPEQATAIDQAMRPTDRDTIVTRRVPASMFAHIPIRDIEGMIARDAAYAPTTLGESDAPGEIRMNIAVPAGTPAIVDPNTGMLLLGRDTEMAVVRVNARPDGGYDMNLIALPKDSAKLPGLDTPADQGQEDPPPTPDPTDGVDLASLSEDDLYSMFSDLSAMDDVPDAAFLRLTDEMDRRERDTPLVDSGPDPDDLTPQQREMGALLDDGVDYFDAYAEVYGGNADSMRRESSASSTLDRSSGETIDEAARRSYDEWNDLQYLSAETATRGHMLSSAGVAAGIDPIELFSGPTARARKYASEDLLRWWADNGRMTFAEFKAQTIGRQSDIKSSERTRLQGNARDFI